MAYEDGQNDFDRNICLCMLAMLHMCCPKKKAHHPTNLMSIEEICQFPIVCYYTKIRHFVYMNTSKRERRRRKIQ